MRTRRQKSRTRVDNPTTIVITRWSAFVDANGSAASAEGIWPPIGVPPKRIGLSVPCDYLALFVILRRIGGGLRALDRNGKKDLHARCKAARERRRHASPALNVGSALAVCGAGRRPGRPSCPSWINARLRRRRHARRRSMGDRAPLRSGWHPQLQKRAGSVAGGCKFDARRVTSPL